MLRSQGLLRLCLVLACAPMAQAEEPPGAVPVGDVVVTATRAERSVHDVAGHVTVIDREEIERSGARNLPELLRRQSGLMVTNTTTNLAGYTIDSRGFNNGGGNGGNTLVQIDGRRANEPDSDTPDWALIPLDQIESIEIVRGPVSALYGDNAVGGVINVRTRPAEGPLRGRLAGRGGSYTTGGGNLSVAGSIGPATASLFLDGVTSDGYREQSAFEAENFQGSAEWNARDRVLVGLRGGYHRDEREFPGSLTQDDIAAFGRRAANPDNAGDHANVEAAFLHGWVEAVLAEDVQLKLQPYWRPRSEDFAFTSLAFGDAFVESEKDSAGVDLQLQVDRPFFGLPNRLLVGGEFLYDERSSASNSTDLSGTCSAPRTTTRTESDRTLGAGFLQEELRVHEDVLLSAGVRYDHAALDLRASDSDPGCPGSAKSRPDYAIWSPRASLAWRPLTWLSAYAAYSRGFRIPSLDEASPLVFPGFVFLPELEAQTSDAGEIGARIDTAQVDATLALYWMSVRDEILFDPVFFANYNLDRVRHRGVELSAAWRPLAWLEIYGNYTFDDIRIEKADNPDLEDSRMPITPRHRGAAGLLFRMPFATEFRAHANFVGERILANDFGQDGGTLTPLGAYAALDLLLAWRPKLTERIGLGVAGVLRNVNGAEFEDFGIRGGGGTRNLYPAATRSWEVGLEVSYRL